jgi:quinohemoprotein ethanol dehydrogenase
LRITGRAGARQIEVVVTEDYSMRIFAALFMMALSVTQGHAQSVASSANTDWALLGNSPEMQHHADLAQINRDTVGKLELAWWTEMPGGSGLVGNPLIRDGIVFQSGPGGQVFANDVRTGKAVWSFTPEINLSGTSFANYLSRQFNRGLALWKDEVIVAAQCHLIALDQKTGKKRWDATSCDTTDMYGITAAPRVGGGLVFTGNNCMDSGLSRGFVDAFDAATGQHKWRFYTVPGDPSKPQDSPLYDMAAKTWGTDWYSKSHGCGSAWDAMTYDPKLHQLYIGVGGPAPWQPTDRALDAGDELFTNSIVALDARTGAYKWHFKEVPHDAWNFDATVGLMVADLPVAGQQLRTVVSVPKDGFAYVLDARTGRFIAGKNYVEVNWTKGLDANGRPIPEPKAMYWTEPDSKFSVVLPSTMGSHGWEALAFDPVSKLLYIPTMVIPTKIERAPPGSVTGILMDFYYGDTAGPQWKPYGELVAWDLLGGAARWRVRATMPINGGLMHTSGGLVFQGMADGRLVAFDAKDGKELWSRQTGGAIRGAPSTVMVDGQQYVVVATGNGAASATGSYVSRYNSTPASRTPPRLLAFRIGGTSAYPHLAATEPVPKPLAPRQSASAAAHGDELFEGFGCPACHGAGGATVGGTVPNLNRQPPTDLAMFKAVVQKGALSAGGMPQFDISDEDAEALFAYVINKAWEVYESDAKALTPSK